MTRYYWSKKTEADNLLKIDINWLKRQPFPKEHEVWCNRSITWSNHLTGETIGSVDYNISNSEEKYLELDYIITRRETGKQDKFNHRLPLTTTKCYFGGVRYWFTCKCGKRVAKLYQGNDLFLCRNCQNLTYQSRNQGKLSPAFLKAIKTIEAGSKIDKLKRKYYKGKPTRKHQALLRKMYINNPEMLSDIINKALNSTRRIKLEKT